MVHDFTTAPDDTPPPIEVTRRLPGRNAPERNAADGPRLFDDNFNPSAAAAAAQAGIEQVGENTPVDAREDLLRAALRVAQAQTTFTVDDVWREYGHDLRNNSGMGTTMRDCARLGIATKTVDVRTSERITRHCNQLPVWRSLVYGHERVWVWRDEAERLQLGSDRMVLPAAASSSSSRTRLSGKDIARLPRCECPLCGQQVVRLPIGGSEHEEDFDLTTLTYLVECRDGRVQAEITPRALVPHRYTCAAW